MGIKELTESKRRWKNQAWKLERDRGQSYLRGLSKPGGHIFQVFMARVLMVQQLSAFFVQIQN